MCQVPDMDLPAIIALPNTSTHSDDVVLLTNLSLLSYEDKMSGSTAAILLLWGQKPTHCRWQSFKTERNGLNECEQLKAPKQFPCSGQGYSISNSQSLLSEHWRPQRKKHWKNKNNKNQTHSDSPDHGPNCWLTHFWGGGGQKGDFSTGNSQLLEQFLSLESNSHNCSSPVLQTLQPGSLGSWRHCKYLRRFLKACARRLSLQVSVLSGQKQSKTLGIFNLWPFFFWWDQWGRNLKEGLGGL